MSDSPTTYMTDFMELVLKEEYERYESEGEIPQFFERFCYDGQLYDEKPTWKYEAIRDWIKESFETMAEGGLSALPTMMQRAIYRDIDQDHLADWLTDKHTNWRDDDEDEEEEEDLDETDIMLLAHPEMTENPDAYHDITTYGADRDDPTPD